jgi:NADH:ubiquinone reductase (H+-translocating)
VCPTAHDGLMRYPRVLVLGTGFAGFHCLRALERRLPVDAAELVAVNPSDYMLYVPLLPEVAGGILDPRRIAVPLRLRLPRTRLVLGEATGVDIAQRTCTVVDVEGRPRTLDWDRLVITCGAVTRLLSVEGVAAYAKGFKTIAEALYLRDHILREIELAELADDPVERRARTTFVVVGAGYTGTEFAAQCQLLMRAALRCHPGIPEEEGRVLLLDLADRVLPGLNVRLAGPAGRALRRRGIDVRLRTSVTTVTPTCVRLSSGEEIPTRTVVWCVGVRPDPLVDALGLPTRNGRLVVDERLTVPGQEDIFAAGDAAAVPDSAHPGDITPMTGQHAQLQGKVAATGIAASLGFGQPRPYRHRELGFVVDLGGWQAVANPFHVPITGPAAKLLARGFHLITLPGGRLRVATDWINEALADRQVVHFGLVPEGGVTLAATDRPHSPMREQSEN